MDDEIQSLTRRLVQAYDEIDELKELLEEAREERYHYAMLLGGLKAKIHLEQKARHAVSRN